MRFPRFLQTGLITMVNSGLSFIGVLVALLFINLKLGLVLLSILPVLVAVTVVFRAKSSKAYGEAREKVSVVNADLQENIAGLRVAQAYRREQVNAAVRRPERGVPGGPAARATLHRAVLPVRAGAVDDRRRAGAVRRGWRGAKRGAHGRRLIAYLLYIDLLFSPIQQLSQVFDGYQQAAVGLRRISGLLRTRTSTPEAAPPIELNGRLRGGIELRDVHFTYTGQSQPALDGVSLSVAPGETVALVGQTGAGKSTLVKLVARFYDVTSGRLLVDGVDVRDYDLGRYRQQLGVVPQEPYLFPGTVRDAIAYGRPDASDAEVEAATRGSARSR